MPIRTLMLLIVISGLIPGCAGEQPHRKPTSPATGKVTVDGNAPGSGIQVQCHPVAGPDKADPTVSATETDADGNFSVSTYTSGDGLPAGDYVFTFTWMEFNVISRSYSGEDKLKGRYSDPEKSTIKLTVKEGEQNDMGVIALTTM